MLNHPIIEGLAEKFLNDSTYDYTVYVKQKNGYPRIGLWKRIQSKYKNNPMNTEDGLKIEFDTDWVHLRTSNTEPIIRIYAESNFETTANNIAKRLMQDIKECSPRN